MRTGVLHTEREPFSPEKQPFVKEQIGDLYLHTSSFSSLSGSDKLPKLQIKCFIFSVYTIKPYKTFLFFLSINCFWLLFECDKCHIHLSKKPPLSPSLASHLPSDPIRQLLKNTLQVPRQEFCLDWRRAEESQKSPWSSSVHTTKAIKHTVSRM